MDHQAGEEVELASPDEAGQVPLPEQGGGSGGHHQLLELVDAVEVVVGGGGAGRRLEGAGDAALLQLLPHEPVRVLEGGVGGGVVLLEAPGEAVLEQVQEQGLGAGQEAWRRCWGWNWGSL